MFAMLLTVVLSTAAPAAAPQDADKRAQESAKAWLELVDAGKYAESWQSASALFKKAVDEASWTKAAAAARQPLGRLESRTFLSATYAETLPGAPDGQYVVIQYQSSFEHKQSAVETITPMVDPDGQWRVSGYYIK